MRRWYAHSNAFMSDDFEQSNMTAVYVPEESDVEAVAEALWDRDENIEAAMSYNYEPHAWSRASQFDKDDYLDEAREALRILGVLG